MSRQSSVEGFTVLRGHKYMNLTSFYASGRGVTTPVWFVEAEGKVYVRTSGDRYKVKRIRQTGRVEVGPGDARGRTLGPVVAAEARVLDDGDDGNMIEAVKKAMRQKYGLSFQMIGLLGALRGRRDWGVFIEVWRTG